MKITMLSSEDLHLHGEDSDSNASDSCFLHRNSPNTVIRMTRTDKGSLVDSNDATLVFNARSGDEQSFGVLVSRHQSAVSAIAYAICGDFSQSEDISQESFVTAWKQIRSLMNPEHFRAWVCGIARMLSLNHVRRRTRRGERISSEIVEHKTLDVSGKEDITPREITVSIEETKLIWHALEAMPLNYREPITLFYREEQSVSAVASALGLSEDVVKQRLSRGRKLLRDQVNRIIEIGMAETKPDGVFTASVIMALPSMTGVGGATAAVGTAGGKAGGLFGASFAMLSSLVSGIISILGLYVLVQYIKNARWSLQFRKVLIQGLARQLVATGTFCALFGGALILNHWDIGSPQGIPVYVFMGLVGLWQMTVLFLAWRNFRKLKSLEGTSPMTHWEPPHAFSCRWESGIRFLGLPLVSVATGSAIDQKTTIFGKARGWIAIGDFALGGLFAMGGVAIAPISLGGIACGFLSIGGITLGMLALGTVAFGFLGIGGIALGWTYAVGGVAVAQELACGSIAIAGQGAVGAIQFAPVVGAAGWALIQDHGIARTLMRLMPHLTWVSLVALPSIVFALRKLKAPSNS